MHKNDINEQCDIAITELAKGNKDSLSIIYDCMARLIFSIAYTIVENYQDAEDVLQDTMITIVRYANTYKNGSNSKAWILAMARNKAIDVVRKRKQTVSFDELDDNIQFAVDCKEFSNFEVFELLNFLREDERQIIVLRLYAEISFHDISKIMDITIASAYKRYQRAIKKLKMNNY